MAYGDLYHCKDCELVYNNYDCDTHYEMGQTVFTCPVDNSEVKLVPDFFACDLEIMDYLGERP